MDENQKIWNESIVSSINESSIEFNRSDNKLPFGLHDPKTDGKIYWICNYDQENNLVGTFYNDDIKEGQVDEQGNGIPFGYSMNFTELDFAVKFRDMLVDSGWKPLVLPGKKFKDSDGNEININSRKNQRKLKKKIQEAVKGNRKMQEEYKELEKFVNVKGNSEVKQKVSKKNKK